METRKGDESVRDDFFENVPQQKPIIENSRGEDIGDGISSSNAVSPRGKASAIDKRYFDQGRGHSGPPAPERSKANVILDTTIWPNDCIPKDFDNSQYRTPKYKSPAEYRKVLDRWPRKMVEYPKADLDSYSDIAEGIVPQAQN